MGHGGNATWPLDQVSSHRKPKTKGLLPVTLPELKMLIFQLGIKETMFLEATSCQKSGC